ncbi:MAG: hypothetical protein R2853_20340 [Thermomicrobiales bacterium]
MPATASLSRSRSAGFAQQRRRSRRAFLGGVGGVAVGLMTGRERSGAQLPIPTPVQGDCTSDPGVELYLGFVLGYPVVQLTDLVVPTDWTLHPNTYGGVIFRQPPGWVGATLYAYEFSPQGMPLFSAQQRPPLAPAVVSARTVSADGAAGFEFASGSLQGVMLSPLQVATVAELGMVGERARLKILCAYEDQNPQGPAWLRVVTVDDETLLLTQGYAIAYSGMMPYTIVTYYSMYGPRAQFEPLMRQVLLRLMAQFYRGPDVSVTPTPTPGP